MAREIVTLTNPTTHAYLEAEVEDLDGNPTATPTAAEIAAAKAEITRTNPGVASTIDTYTGATSRAVPPPPPPPSSGGSHVLNLGLGTNLYRRLAGHSSGPGGVSFSGQYTYQPDGSDNFVGGRVTHTRGDLDGPRGSRMRASETSVHAVAGRYIYQGPNVSVRLMAHGGIGYVDIDSPGDNTQDNLCTNLPGEGANRTCNDNRTGDSGLNPGGDHLTVHRTGHAFDFSAGADAEVAVKHPGTGLGGFVRVGAEAGYASGSVTGDGGASDGRLPIEGASAMAGATLGGTWGAGRAYQGGSSPARSSANYDFTFATAGDFIQHGTDPIFGLDGGEVSVGDRLTVDGTGLGGPWNEHTRVFVVAGSSRTEVGTSLHPVAGNRFVTIDASNPNLMSFEVIEAMGDNPTIEIQSDDGTAPSPDQTFNLDLQVVPAKDRTAVTFGRGVQTVLIASGPVVFNMSHRGFTRATDATGGLDVGTISVRNPQSFKLRVVGPHVPAGRPDQDLRIATTGAPQPFIFPEALFAGLPASSDYTVQILDSAGDLILGQVEGEITPPAPAVATLSSLAVNPGTGGSFTFRNDPMSITVTSDIATTATVEIVNPTTNAILKTVSLNITDASPHRYPILAGGEGRTLPRVRGAQVRITPAGGTATVLSQTINVGPAAALPPSGGRGRGTGAPGGGAGH